MNLSGAPNLMPWAMVSEEQQQKLERQEQDGQRQEQQKKRQEKQEHIPSLTMDRNRRSESTTMSSNSTGQNSSLSPVSGFTSSPVFGKYHSCRKSTSDQSSSPMKSYYFSEDHAIESELPLFDIEKDGDPRIECYMYYDFFVTKTEAYFDLRPGYLVTDKYPQRVKSERVMFKGKPCHPCRIQGCESDPFTRHYDLERHFRTIHDRDPEQKFYCDYTKCPRKDPFWKIHHCREHYREYHNEDLIKRFKAKSDQPPAETDKSKRSNDKPHTVEEFLATRRWINYNWWRCGKCLERVHINGDGFVCPRCNVPCESERVAFRAKKQEEDLKYKAFEGENGSPVKSSYETSPSW